MKRLVVTIDGPAGAGKTTVSRILAERLGYRYLDTGALYRGVAFEAESAGIKPDDDKGLEELCRNLELEFVQGEKGSRLLCNGLDISERIRTPKISLLASAVSARAGVRRYLLDLQRNMGKEKAVVAEGRDMGTVVFPDADVKFFLDASSKIRAQRRHQEFTSKTSQSLEDVEMDIRQRDKNDSTRNLAPLKPAIDAIIIDSSELSVQEAVNRMLSHVKRFL